MVAEVFTFLAKDRGPEGLVPSSSWETVVMLADCIGGFWKNLIKDIVNENFEIILTAVSND